jgi:SRSO17 transposase
MVEADAAVWSGWLDVVMSIISPVFAQARSRRAGFDYVRTLLRAEGRRSCWQLAELAGHASPRRLQALLAIDETAELKAGDQTVGVAAQYAGITGQVENCQTVVFLAYVTARAHALWPDRCRSPGSWPTKSTAAPASYAPMWNPWTRGTCSPCRPASP